MVSLERKFDVLHHSISSFTRWLDGCNSLLEDMASTRASLDGQEEEAVKMEGGSVGDAQSRGEGRGKDGGVTKVLEGGGKDECVGGEGVKTDKDGCVGGGGVKTDKEEKELRGLALKYKVSHLRKYCTCTWLLHLSFLSTFLKLVCYVHVFPCTCTCG